jgi:VanZ family protein
MIKASMPRRLALAVLSLPLILCSGALFWLSSIPGLTPPDLGVSWNDKIYHAIAFLGWGWCCVIAVLSWMPQASARAVAMTVLSIGLLYAMSDEWHQSFVINRSAGWDDVAADVVGLFLATTTIPLFRRLLLRYRLLG